MNNELKILIKASLNIGKTIDEINTQIKGLQKKVNNLKLNVEINDKVLSTLNNFSKQIEKLKDNALNTGKIIEETLMPDGTKVKRTFVNGLNGEFSEVIKKAKELKTNLESTNQSATQQAKELAKGYDVLSNKIEKFNAQQQKLAETLKYQNETGTKTRTVNLDADGNIKGYVDTENLKKEIEVRQSIQDAIAKTIKKREEENRLWNQNQAKAINKQLEKEYEERQKLAELMAQGREHANAKRMQEELRLQESQAKAINKAIENAQKEKEKQEELNKELEYQINLYQRLMQAKANNLKDIYGDRIDKQALTKELDKVMTVNPANFNSMKEFRRWQQEVNTGFKEIALNAKNSSNHAGNFINQFSVAMQRIPVWFAGMTAFYAPLRGLQDALSQIIEIDAQMTSLARVTDDQTNINDLLKQSIDLADKLGNKVQQVNEGLIEFSKMGFRGEDLTKITEAATLMSNVSDLSVDESASSLTSALKGFSMQATQAMHIVDALNEVDLIKVPYGSNVIEKTR